MQHTTVAPASASAGIHGQIEDFLHTALQALLPAESATSEPPSAGRPCELPSLSLWMAVLVGSLRRLKSQRALWRLLASSGLWSLPTYDIVDQTVYDRLEAEGLGPLQALFERIRQILAHWLAPAVAAYEQQGGRFAPFAKRVYALDEMWADPVRRLLPCLRVLKKGDLALLPGKIVALWDVRWQQWRAIEYVSQVTDNSQQHARAMLPYIEVGSLLLFDLGYFGFEWLDELTAAGIWWVSRLREKTSYQVLHTYYQDGETFDGLIWLGTGKAQAGSAVRLVQFRVGLVLYRYLTNVTDPQLLSLHEIARLYVRRWDIELAFLTLKEHLGLHLWWSSKPAVVLAQLWACLIIAQILQALRMEVAFRAQVDPFEVSLPLLIDYLPQWAAQGCDAISECVRQGRTLGIIRPSSRTRVQAPHLEPSALTPRPADLVLKRAPRYPARRPHKGRSPTKRAQGWREPPYALLAQ